MNLVTQGVVGFVAMAVTASVAVAELRPGVLRTTDVATLTVSEVENHGVFGLERGDEVRLVRKVRDPLPHERMRIYSEFVLKVEKEEQSNTVRFRVVSTTKGTCGEMIYVGTRIFEGPQPMDMPLMNIRVVDHRSNLCERVILADHLWEVSVVNSFPFGGPNGEGHLSRLSAHGQPRIVYTTRSAE